MQIRSKSKLLEMQVRLAKARWVELQERYKASPKVVTRIRTIHVSDRAGLVFSLRHLKKLTYVKIAAQLGTSPTGASTLCNALEVEWFKRTRVPVFHSLDGDTWSASNCSIEHDDRYWPASAHKNDTGWVHRGKHNDFPFTSWSYA